MIEKFYHESFIGKPVKCHRDFTPTLEIIADLAKKCDVQVFIVSSLRKPHKTLSGAIVKPASMSNHFVGHAIDINLFSPRIGFLSSKRLYKEYLASSEAPAEASYFMSEISNHPSIRWGGDFVRQDPVHIDDSLNVRNKDLWIEKYENIWGIKFSYNESIYQSYLDSSKKIIQDAFDVFKK